jgi:hypothetical protein
VVTVCFEQHNTVTTLRLHTFYLGMYVHIREDRIYTVVGQTRKSVSDTTKDLARVQMRMSKGFG